jgi:hypothetical protein
MVSNYAFPRLDIPDGEKDEKYHESFARAIINKSVSDSWRNNWLLISECYKFLEEGSNGELVGHLQTADDSTALPAMWLSLNTIPSKIDLLVGELQTRGYNIRVKALNKEAVDRKLEERERLRVKRKLQPLFATADKEAGMSFSESEYIPQSEQELNEYIDLSFKDKAELIMGGALKWIAQREDWDSERAVLFRDVLASGRVWAKTEIVRGIPRSRRKHPLNMIFDTSAKRDDLSDSSFFGELEYLPISTAAEKFNLSTAELETVYSQFNSFQNSNPANEVATGATDYSYGFNTIGGNRVSWFDAAGDLKVLVAHAVWRDYKFLNTKTKPILKTDRNIFRN